MSLFQKKIWFETKPLVPYPNAIAIMQDYIAQIAANTAASLFWALEHPPLLTAGVRAKKEDLISSDSLPIFQTNRGGQWTYHGPGQQIIYTMLDLRKPQGNLHPHDLRQFVFLLEEWIIATLDSLGLKSFRQKGLTGVWVFDSEHKPSKIAAIGLRATKWISWHGVSLNLNPALSHYKNIIPCGIQDYSVTSLHAQGITISMPELRQKLYEKASYFFGEFISQVGSENSAFLSASRDFENVLEKNMAP